MSTASPSIYDPRVIRALFDEMSRTYGLVNFISSFGFCRRWRRQCVGLADIRPGMNVVDLMCGMGECWPFIVGRLGGPGSITGVDYCAEMCRRARDNAPHHQPVAVSVNEEDALSTTLPDASADVVLGSFAIKTLDPTQLDRFAAEVRRILRPGGTFAFLEISVPPNRALRTPYLFYLNHIVPWIGRACLGNPDNYRLLGVYTRAFGDCGRLAVAMREREFDVQSQRLFFGCATAIRGRRPT